MAHTPGEWIAFDATFEQADYLDPPSGEPPMVQIGNHTIAVPTNDDAHLIAAGPKMLAALKQAKAIVEAEMGDWLAVDRVYLPSGYISMRDVLDTIEAAIAAAEPTA